MSTIGNSNTSALAGTNPLYENKVADQKVTEAKVGVGVGAQAGKVPDAPAKGQANQGTTGARASLSAFMFTGAQVDTEVLLVQVAVSMRDTEATSQKAKINTDQETKKAQSMEKERKLEESQKKMEEAERKKNSGNLIDKIKLAFEWLGAILAAATAVILIAIGVTAAVGAALLAAAVVAIVMAVNSTVQMATGQGIAGNISMAVDKMNNANGTNNPPLSMDQMKERAGKADMGFTISMAILGVAFAIVSGGSSMVNSLRSLGSGLAAAGKAGLDAVKVADQATSAVKALKDIASAMKTAFYDAMKMVDDAYDAAQAGKEIWKVSQKMAEFTARQGGEMQHIAGMAQTSVTTMDATVQVANVGAEAGSMAMKYQQTTLTADAKKMAADAKIDDAMMQMLDDMIDQALSRLMAASDRFNTMLDDITSSIQDRGDTMSRAKFQG